MFAVDTNVFVHAANRDSLEHKACLRFIEERRARPEPWCAPWNVFYEFLRVVTHPKVLVSPWPLERAQSFVRAVLASENFSVLVPTERHAAILEATIAETPGLRGNLVHDLNTAVLMREHGVRRIATRDADFHRFKFLEVVDPLAIS